MPLETATLISDLDATNPAHTDQLNQADAHLRLIKGALKNTFPNVNAVVNASDEDLNALNTGQLSAQDGTSGAPSITFKNDSTAGFRKGARAGQTAISGTLRGSGALPAGMLADFPIEPPRFSKGAAASGGQAAVDWLELDGSAYNVTDFPDLAAFLGVASGTFSLPNLKDVGRFRRSRTSTLAAGTSQAHALRNHTHSGTTDAAGAHSHTATVANTLNTTVAVSPEAGVSGADSGANVAGGGSGTKTRDQPAPMTGSISVSVAAVGDHTHTFTTGITGDDTETRPVSFVVVSCIKT